MERRSFISVAVAAPVALLPFYPSPDAPAATPASPSILPAVEEPPLFFYVATAETDSGKRLLDEIATSPEDIQWSRKHSIGEKKQYRRVRFVPLEREDRFAVCETAWSSGVPDYRLLEHGTPEYEAAWDAYFEALQNLAPPCSLLDVPAVIEDHQSGWTQDTFPLSRTEAMEMAADMNERSILDGLLKEGAKQRAEWYVVVELGRPVSRAFLEIEFDRNGFGVMKRERQWPLRLVRPTAEEIARFPVTAELLAKGGVA